MEDNELLRYARHIMLPEVDVAGQQRLLDSHALIIGLGGLGSPSSMYLAASGVGTLTLVDHDIVELSNLQRQIVHDYDQLGEHKVVSAAQRLRALNADTTLNLVDHKLEGKELHKAVAAADVVLDGSDNFKTRFAINDACVATGTPLVSAAVIRTEGQLTVIDPRVNSPCYRCLYPNGEEGDQTCSENGVLAPVAGIFGTIQATEALKLLLGLGECLIGRLLAIDARTMSFRDIRLKKDPACPVCGTRG